MPLPSLLSGLTLDFGNTRVKCAWFERLDVSAHSRNLPQVTAQAAVTRGAEIPWSTLQEWRNQVPAAATPVVIVSSVRPDESERWLQHWDRSGWPAPIQLAVAEFAPLPIDVEAPERVGVDRLAKAVAVNLLRVPDHPAVVIDAGTATTVDLVTANGHFAGGAILPGISLGARALHEATSLLPEVELEQFPPQIPALGRNTLQALQSGLFWGQVGAIREIASRLAALAGSDTPGIFVTGGAGERLAAELSPTARYLPELTLAGIAEWGRVCYLSRLTEPGQPA